MSNIVLDEQLLITREEAMQYVECAIVNIAGWTKEQCGRFLAGKFLDLNVSFVVSEEKLMEGRGKLVETGRYFFFSSRQIAELNLDVNKLTATAFMNARKNDVHICNVKDMLPPAMTPSQTIPLYYVSSVGSVTGATVILNPIPFYELAERFGDLYILSSSIHEVLAAPVGFIGTDKEEIEMLKRIVLMVNQNIVADDEVLGNSVYVWKQKERRLEVVSSGILELQKGELSYE